MSNSTRRRSKRLKMRTEKQRRYSFFLTKERMAIDSKLDPDWLMGHPPEWHKVLLIYGRDESGDAELHFYNKRVIETFLHARDKALVGTRLQQLFNMLEEEWAAGWRPHRVVGGAA